MKTLDRKTPITKITSEKFLGDCPCGSGNCNCNCGRPKRADLLELENLNKSFASIYAQKGNSNSIRSI